MYSIIDERGYDGSSGSTDRPSDHGKTPRNDSSNGRMTKPGDSLPSIKYGLNYGPAGDTIRQNLNVWADAVNQKFVLDLKASGVERDLMVAGDQTPARTDAYPSPEQIEANERPVPKAFIQPTSIVASLIIAGRFPFISLALMGVISILRAEPSKNWQMLLSQDEHSIKFRDPLFRAQEQQGIDRQEQRLLMNRLSRTEDMEKWGQTR